MDSALLWAGFHENGHDGPRQNFHFCAFHDCVSIWAEVNKFILEAKWKCPLAFCQPPLSVSSALFPDLPQVSEFHQPECAGGDAGWAWYWGADGGMGVCSGRHARVAPRTCQAAVWQWPGSLPHQQWFMLLSGKRQVGQMSCSCRLRGWCFSKVSGSYVTRSSGKFFHTMCCSSYHQSFLVLSQERELSSLRLKSGFSCPVLGLVLLCTYWLIAVFMLADTQLLNNQHVVDLVTFSSIPLPIPRMFKEKCGSTSGLSGLCFLGQFSCYWAVLKSQKNEFRICNDFRPQYLAGVFTLSHSCACSALDFGNIIQYFTSARIHKLAIELLKLWDWFEHICFYTLKFHLPLILILKR